MSKRRTQHFHTIPGPNERTRRKPITLAEHMRQVREAIEAKRHMTLIVTDDPRAAAEYILTEGLPGSCCHVYSTRERAMRNAQWCHARGIATRLVILLPEGGVA